MLLATISADDPVQIGFATASAAGALPSAEEHVATSEEVVALQLSLKQMAEENTRLSDKLRALELELHPAQAVPTVASLHAEIAASLAPWHFMENTDL